MTSTRPFVCPSDAKCRHPATTFDRKVFNAPNTNSYAYVPGLTETSSSDSPLMGDNIVDPSRADQLGVQQFQERAWCDTKGSNHGAAGGNVVFVDGHAAWNVGNKLKTRWVDSAGGTSEIKNPNGLQ